VDAVEGPMPQTTFVTKKALAQGLKPIVVVNKVDRLGARPDWAVDHMTPLFEAIVKHAPVPDVDPDGALQMQVSALDYSSYTGVIGIGRVVRGKMKRNSQVIVVQPDGTERKAKVLLLYGFMGLERVEMDEVSAGDICCFTGIDKLGIYEALTVDVESDHQGSIMEKLGERKGQLKDMVPDGQGRVRLDYEIPTRGLIGFRSEFLTLTSGTGLLYHNFDAYKPRTKAGIGRRQKGVLISKGDGKAAGFALWNLQDRGKMFIGHAEEVYEGMIVGINARDNDLVVNVLKRISSDSSLTYSLSLIDIASIASYRFSM